jgi:hypothetical protein
MYQENVVSSNFAHPPLPVFQSFWNFKFSVHCQPILNQKSNNPSTVDWSTFDERNKSVVAPVLVSLKLMTSGPNSSSYSIILPFFPMTPFAYKYKTFKDLFFLKTFWWPFSSIPPLCMDPLLSELSLGLTILLPLACDAHHTFFSSQFPPFDLARKFFPITFSTKISSSTHNRSVKRSVFK